MPWSHLITKSFLRFCHDSLFKVLRCDQAMWWCRIDLFCLASGDMRGVGVLNVIEVQPTESDRIDVSISLQQAGLICWLDQVKGLNGCCSAAILSDLNTLNLARSLRQIVYLFRSTWTKPHKVGVLWVCGNKLIKSLVWGSVKDFSIILFLWAHFNL